MERLTQTSNSGGVTYTFDLDITCQPSEAGHRGQQHLYR